MSVIKKTKKAVKKLSIFFLALIIVFVFLIVGFGKEYIGNLQIQREIAELEQERGRLEKEKLQTLSLIDDLSSEYYLEKEGREKHGLIKQGETLIVIDSLEGLEYEDKELEEMGKFANVLFWYEYFFNPVLFSTRKDI